MKSTKANTQIGVTFRVVEFEDADIAALIAGGGEKATRITDCVNADRRQKVALVDARYDLSKAIDALGFARKTKDVSKEGETMTVPDETEGEHIQRFVDGLVAGTTAAAGFTLPSGDNKQKENAAYAFLQTMADACGDKKDENGQSAYILNLDKATRAAGTGLIPKWAMDGALQIINNGSQAKWAEKFTAGYTSGAGVAIDPIAFTDFQQVAAADATPEAKQAVLTSNQRNLAKCLMEQRAQENAKRAPEFA